MIRFIDTGENSGAMNMAIDEALLIAQAKYGSPPVVRVYRFAPPTLSIGVFQSAIKEVNFEKIRELGFGFVRRPTGGRAVLHDKELTYSITIAYPHRILDLNLLQSFHLLSTGIIKAIQKLGGNPNFSQKESKISTPSCFAAPTFSDILINGKKVVGSAQMRNKYGLLQHGSIVYDVKIEHIFDCFNLSEHLREKFIKIGYESISSLSKEIGRSINFYDIKDALKEGMEEIFGEKLVESALSIIEWEIAYELFKNKYNTIEWNMKK
uniref:Lipoate--protein ligase family protein n=1 Tax=Caldisericum exile TaxID=693075 RepID=A0A7C4YEQ4_9BACT